MKVPKIYFYCRNEEGNLQEDVITLAEGFRELGIPYYANCDYWQQSVTPGDYLFRHDPEIRPDDCDVVIVSYTWPYWIRMKTFDLVRCPLPEGLFKNGRKYKTVYMDNHDGHRTVSWEPEFRQFDLILRSKLNSRAWHPTNMRPWVHGFTNRILKEVSGAPPFSERRRSLLWNFGASHPYPHGAREQAVAKFLPAASRLFDIDTTRDDLSAEPGDPYEALMWRQTSCRFSRAYYQRLQNAKAVASFCGELIPPMPYRDPECYLVGGNRAKIRRATYDLLALLDPRAPRSVQWDSFRFWEALAAGCVTFNLDLAYYGVDIPIMPENWKHYIGVNLNNVPDVIQRINEEPQCLERISVQGRNWAMEYYRPRKMAERFLEYVKNL